MDAQSDIEPATMEAGAHRSAAVGEAAHETANVMDLLELDDFESVLTSVDRESLDLLEESIRHALEGMGAEMPAAAAVPAPVAEAVAETFGVELHGAEPPVTETALPEALAQEMPGHEAPSAEADASSRESLEAVELELALHNQNLISLGFEESIRTALQGVGGEMLFQMRLERDDCQRIAAVRIGDGDERQFALVIMPPDGGLMRVEPVEQSTNPLAMITESYAGLMDVFRAAA